MVSSTGRERTKVLLIYPPVRLAAAPRIPPFGYLYMGAVLEEAGMEVEILDQNVLRLPVDDLMTEIGNRDFDVIGIGGMTTVYYYINRTFLSWVAVARARLHLRSFLRTRVSMLFASARVSR
jgi:hypothetical protein